jgi:hypothetical protein
VHIIATLSPRYCHVIATLLPRYRHVITIESFWLVMAGWLAVCGLIGWLSQAVHGQLELPHQ